MKKKIDKVYKNAPEMIIDDSSRIVIMSDCHRGIGNINDNFKKNKEIFIHALQYYNTHKFTYLELGDGDEMWEVKNYQKIIDEYIDVFKLIKKFADDERFLMFYGNHDILKKNKKIIDKYFSKYNQEDLFNDLTIYEALILKYYDKEIFLLHGHQADILNSTFWRLSRFLIRYFWRFFEPFGLKITEKDVKNYEVKKKCEKRLEKWGKEKKKIVISGHTHHPIFPKEKESLYFNDGSCIQKEGITCLEINNGKISLVKWEYIFQNNNIVIERQVIKGCTDIKSFFNISK